MADATKVERYQSIGAQMIAAERRRQVVQEGWTPEHDDGHTHGELAFAAAQLIVHGSAPTPDAEYEDDIWGLVEKHGGDELRSLVIAGALIAAEIDRLLRLAND